MGKRENIKGRKRSPLLFGITFRAILVVAAAALFLSYISVYVNPAKFALPLFFGLYFIPILGINLLLLLAALLRRSASAWITVVALLPALLYTELFFKIGGKDEIVQEGISLSIESWNVGMFSSAEGSIGREECRKKVAEHFAERSPQIICLQEFFVENTLQADTIFSSYPYRHYHLFKARNGKLFGNIILSKFPLGDRGRISFPNSTNLSIYADVDHFGRKLRIYNNHLESYNVSFASLVQKFTGKGHIAGEELRHDIVETHEKMKGTFIRRSEQVNRIMEDINLSRTPAIICGDFNDTPMSYTYHTLAKKRIDTFKEAGRGFGGTYIPVWPLLRIDYLLIPDNTGCTNHTLHKTTLSDHFPISANIII